MDSDAANGARRVAGSFRDPSGFLFERDGALFRQVNRRYRADYDLLMSGLYQELVEKGLMVAHEEVDAAPAGPDAYKVIRPERIRFISYPYEWSFSQLRHAAVATLRIQEIALKHGMVLKDASAYNIQFRGGRGPAFIDTLSFEKYEEGKPWVAYRQFCQHFLAPLALMAYTDVGLNKLARLYIDGVPLELASRLLPRRTRLKVGLFAHIHLHARSQREHADTKGGQRKVASAKVSKQQLLALIDGLKTTTKGLKWAPTGTEWGDYYNDTNYTPAGQEHKKKLVSHYLAEADGDMIWDLGGNIGLFSRLASDKGRFTVCFDIDPAAVDKNYQDARKAREEEMLPLVSDLTNPSPGIGWHNTERMSILERGPADCAMALALIHHLAISNNVPLDKLADFLADASRFLIIEWVPKEDSQVQRLLLNREDVFPQYDQASFEAAFSERFTIVHRDQVEDSKRTMYLMKRNQRA